MEVGDPYNSKRRAYSCRTKFRREANQADNKAATTAVDSLINYEAVKVGFLRWMLLQF